MNNIRTNSDRSNPRESEDEGSDDGVIVINMDGYDLTDNENQDDYSRQPKEEIKDPAMSNINSNQDLNMDDEDNSLNEQLKPTFNTSYQNDLGTLDVLRSNPEVQNGIPMDQERISEEGSQEHDESSNNDLVVKLDLNQID